MNIIEQLNWRYATKSFDDKRIIPEKDISALIEAFNLTATSYGLQPLKMIVIHDKTLQEELVPCSYNQKQVAQASHVLVLSIETQLDTAYINEYFDRAKQIRNTPDDVLNPFKDFLIKDFEGKTTAEKETWATKQAYIALGNLLTVCAVLNIDSCPMEGFVPKEYDRLLGLNEKNLKSVLVLPIGYRAPDDFMADLKKVRKPLDNSVIIM